MTQPTHRFNELDLLRGFACVAVVAFHYLSRSPRVGWMPGALSPSIDAVARYGYLGVHLFFVISGFVILMSAQSASPRQFVASRVARLYPALWVAASLTAGTAWLLGDQAFQVSLPVYLINLSMVPHWFGTPAVDGAYWSLFVELHFYLYVWIALKLRLLHKTEWLLMAWLAISLVNAIRPAWPVELWLNAKWAPLFAAGGVYYLMRMQGITPRRIGMLLVSYLLALFYARPTATLTGPEATGPVNAWVVWGVITAVYLVFLLIALDRWRMPASRLTRLAGALTYPVYVVHQVFGAMVYQRVQSALKSAPVALFVTVFMVALISWAIHRGVEKTTGPRLRRWLEGNARAHILASSTTMD